MAETERINKAELYKRKVGTPQLTSSDIERIKDIRQKRYKQEQIRKLKREAKPIKKQNISKINQEINKYQKLINRYKKEAGEEYKKRREWLREKRDNRGQEWYEEEVKELKLEREEAENKLDAYQKGLNELKKEKKKYDEFDWKKVISNKDYIERVVDYADDLTDAEIREAERKRRFKEQKEEYSEQIEELTSGKLKPDEYARKYAKLPERLQRGLLAPGGSGGYGARYEKALEKAKEAQFTSEEKKKISAWMQKYKMSPSPEKIQEIIKRPIEKPKQTKIAYKNVLTGEIVKKSIAPEVAKKDLSIQPTLIDETGKELSTEEQVKTFLKSPRFRERAYGEFTPEEQTFIENINRKGILPAMNEEINQMRTKLSKYITKNELKKMEDRINKLEEAKNTFDIGDDPSLSINKEIKSLKNAVKSREKQLKAGVASPSAQLGVLGAEIAIDFAIPLVGVIDLGILIGSEATKFKRESWENAKKWMGGKEITAQDLEDIKKSSVFTQVGGYSGEQIQKVKENIERGGLIDGLKKSSEQGIQAGKDAWNGLVEFWTKASAIEEMKEKKKELITEKNELKKDKGDYEIESYNSAIKQYDNTIEQIDENILRLKNQRDVTQGATYLILATGIAGGIAAGARRRLRNIELGKYDDAIKRYKKLQNFAKNDVRLIRGKGVQKIDSYTGNFKRIDDIGVLKKIENIDNVKKIDVIQDSQVYVKRNPIFETIDVPDSLKSVEKSNRYYLTYLPDALTPEQLNRMSISQINSLPGYKTYWKNALTYNVIYKDGSNRAFSLIARSNKPLPNFRKPINAIKYGADKKIVLSSKIGDNIIKSHVARIRGGRFYYEDTLFTKGRSMFETRRPARLPAETKRRLTPEEYWTISPRKAAGKITPVSKEAKDITKISPESFFFGTQTRRVSKVATVTSPITVDTGALELALRNRVRMLSRIKPSKLTKSQKALKNISSKLDNAVKSGKRTIKLKPKTVNKLENIDIQTVRNVAASVEVSAPTTKIPKAEIKTINNVNRELTALSSNLNQIESKSNKIINKIESKQFTRTLNKKDVDKAKKSINNIKGDIKTSVKNVERNISKSKQVLRNLEKNKQKYSSVQVSGQVNRIRQAVNQAQRVKQGYRLRLKQLNIIQNEITATPSPTTTTPQPPTPTVTTRVPRIELPGFPGDSRRRVTETRKRVKGYQTEIRRGGKWIKVGEPTTKDMAKLRGVKETGITLAQSFRIRPTKQKVPKTRKVSVNLNKYYKKKTPRGEIWIEKPKSKIDTPQEKRALKRARKSAEDYWFGGGR